MEVIGEDVCDTLSKGHGEEGVRLQLNGMLDGETLTAVW